MPLLRTLSGIPMVTQGGAPLRPAGANVVVNPPVQPVSPRINSISPSEPGALTETTAGAGVQVTFTVSTTAIANLGWAVVQNDANFTWRSSGTVATGGSVSITVTFFAAGDFFKVYDNSNSALTLDTPGVSSFTKAGGGTTTPPATGGGEGTVYEGFDDNTTGLLSHRWGDTSKISVSGGIVTIAGTYDGAGAMELPSGRDVGHSYGLYEIHAQLRGDTVGDNSGPCVLVWPSDDIWPGYATDGGYAREIDIGEISGDGRTYFATHWYDSGWGGNNAYRIFWVQDTFPNFNQYDWHTYAAFLQRDKITYYVDGTVIGVETQNPPKAYVDGGTNYVLGIMNRSSQTETKCDWVRFTPEATVLANGGTTTPPPTGGGGGTTPPPATVGASQDLAGPGGGSVGAFGIQLQGQSNAAFFLEDQLPTGGRSTGYTRSVFESVIQSLTNLTSSQVFLNGSNNVSVVGGTATYSLQNNDACWLRGFDQDWSNPSSWPNNSLMTDFLNWAGTQAGGIPAGRPVSLIRMHTEYDSRQLTTQAERDVYEKVSREFIKRWRDRIGRGVSLTPVFLVSVPYYSNAEMNETIRAAWRNMCADSSLNCYMGVGSTIDVSSRESKEFDPNQTDYFSHWDTEGSARVARRLAIRMAKWMHGNGYANRDLTNLPTLGPRFSHCVRVSGVANRLDLKVAHDGGTDITVPSNTNLEAYTVNDNGTVRGVTAAVRADASTVRLSLSSNLSAAGPITVSYGQQLWFFDEAYNQYPGGTIYDNRHTLAWPVSNTQLNNTRMNLQRLRAPITETAPSGGGGTTPAATVRLEPTSPGPVTQSGAGVGATVSMDIVSTGTSSVTHVVVQGAPSYAFRGTPVDTATTGRVTIQPRFYATGDFVKAWSTGSLEATATDSSPVVVNTAATGGGGTLPPATGGAFDPVGVKRGWPLNNNQFEYFAADRDWEYCYINPTQGFAGIRWQPTWKRADGFYGSWEPAEVEVYRVYRRGNSGQDAQTLVLECGPNPASVPAGDKVVLFQVGEYNGSVIRNTSMNLNGFNVPMRQKLNVIRSQGSATYDTNGRQRIEIDLGSALPAIDHYPGDSAGGGKNLRVRHWSFYKNAATKELRHPLGWFKDLSITETINNGGYIMLGGLQGQPTWYDWTEDYRNFGASLIEELWRMECQGLADYFGSVDPAKLAIELENEPTRSWGAESAGVGYGDLLPDVWYGMARQIWGSSHTLVVKGTNFGGLDDLLATYDFTNPSGHRTHLVTHNYDGQPHYPNGSALNWGDIGQTDWYADQLKKKIVALGYTGGGMTEFGAGPHEWWDYNLDVDDAERGRRHGRILTSLTNQGLYLFPWGSVGDNHNASGIYTIDGRRIEAYHPGLRPYCNRSGATRT